MKRKHDQFRVHIVVVRDGFSLGRSREPAPQFIEACSNHPEQYPIGRHCDTRKPSIRAPRLPRSHAKMHGQPRLDLPCSLSKSSCTTPPARDRPRSDVEIPPSGLLLSRPTDSFDTNFSDKQPFLDIMSYMLPQLDTKRPTPTGRGSSVYATSATQPGGHLDVGLPIPRALNMAASVEVLPEE